MAISYVGGQTFSVTAASPSTNTITYALTGGSNSTPSTNDLVIVGYGEGAGGDATLSARISTSGFSLVTELFAADTNNSNLAVFRKFMGATPDTTLVVVGATSGNAAATVNIQVWRGVNLTTPLDPTTTTATASNSGNVDPAAITPASGGNIIAIFGNSASASADTATFTAGSTAYMTDFRQVARSGAIYRGTGGSGYVTGQPSAVSYNPAAWALTADSIAFAWTAATLALRPDPNVSVTGVSATGSVGTATVTAKAIISVTGVSAAGQVGTATVVAKATVSPTGIAAVGSVGSVAVTLQLNVPVAGVSASGDAGTATVVAKASAAVSGISAIGSVGDVFIRLSQNITVAGLSATGEVGFVATNKISQRVYVTGLSAYGYVGNALVWGIIIPGQDPNYDPLNPSQTPAYSQISPNQSPGFSSIAPIQSSGYNQITPSQSSNWVPVIT